PQSPKAFLHFIDPNEAPQNLLPGNPVAQAEFSDKDNAYHFELTQFISNGIINELDDEKEFYLTLPNNGGILLDLLFVGPETIQPPELVITYFKKYQYLTLKKIAYLTFLFCFCSTAAWAQSEDDKANSSSVYSKLGVGFPVSTANTAAHSM